MKLHTHLATGIQLMLCKPVLIGKGAQGLPVTQHQPHFAGPVFIGQYLFDGGHKAIAARFDVIALEEQLHPAGLEQRDHGGIERQLQTLGAASGDQRLDL